MTSGVSKFKNMLDGVSSVKPSPADDFETPSPAEIARRDSHAEQAGFTNTIAPRSPTQEERKTPVTPRPSKGQDKDPIVQMSIRLPHSYSERLKAHSLSERYSYGELIQMWLDRDGIGL